MTGDHELAIETMGLRKRYGKVVALDGVDLRVERGIVFGLLGPNGAGKTTAVRILTTLLQPDEGSASVAGIDVLRHPAQVRERIGLAGQYAAVDDNLTGFENLEMVGRLYHLGGGKARERARELLDEFELSYAGGRLVRTYSGGMQRRLDVALGLINRPQVLFLDEPTVGLDPQARLDLWDILRDLHRQGRTLIMTTHYMEEADQLCDRVAIVDRGKLLALDTPERLKLQAPGGLVELTLDRAAEAAVAGARALAGVTRAESADGVLRAYTDRGGELIPALIRTAEAAGCQVRDIHLLRPSLETLFISLTGRKLD
jgi:ABC-2 type transport system ATP-binding protein